MALTGLQHMFSDDELAGLTLSVDTMNKMNQWAKYARIKLNKHLKPSFHGAIASATCGNWYPFDPDSGSNAMEKLRVLHSVAKSVIEDDKALAIFRRVKSDLTMDELAIILVVSSYIDGIVYRSFMVSFRNKLLRILEQNRSKGSGLLDSIDEEGAKYEGVEGIEKHENEAGKAEQMVKVM